MTYWELLTSSSCYYSVFVIEVEKIFVCLLIINEKISIFQEGLEKYMVLKYWRIW